MERIVIISCVTAIIVLSSTRSISTDRLLRLPAIIRLWTVAQSIPMNYVPVPGVDLVMVTIICMPVCNLPTKQVGSEQSRN